MTMDTIKKAEDAAHRFLAAADAIRVRLAQDADFNELYGIVGYKETGALRRSSMDLTRALAEMRKPK